MDTALRQTADALEGYIESHLFDPQGIMYAYIDGHTGRPLERDRHDRPRRGDPVD